MGGKRGTATMRICGPLGWEDSRSEAERMFERSPCVIIDAAHMRKWSVGLDEVDSLASVIVR